MKHDYADGKSDMARFRKKGSGIPEDTGLNRTGGRKALYALTNGAGQFEQFKEQLVTAYAGIYLAEHGYGQDLLAEFNTALEETLACYARAESGKGFRSLKPKHGERMTSDCMNSKMADRAELASAIVESYRRVAIVVP